MRDAWVLRMKDEAKEGDMVGDYYFCDEAVDTDIPWLTDELQEATIFDDKENAIQDMKKHEEYTFKEFGEGAVCNYGYTNMMKNFEFVEVTVGEEENCPI